MKKVAILQSNYIPWKGYFDIINSVDEFIFYDEMQYTKNDWRNRNKIKSSSKNKLSWLTIPVFYEFKGIETQKINETLISDSLWGQKHWSIIENNYKSAPYFNLYKDIFKDLYFNNDEKYLCEINYKFIRVINRILNIKTKLSFSTDYKLIDGKTERLVDLVQQANGTEYISGPAAKDYIDNSLFENAGIKLSWFDYSGYSEYNQLFPPFEHGVSILDLLFNEGENAKSFMKSFNK